MRRLYALACSVMVLCGCVTVQVPSYIKAEQPYSRKVLGNYDQIAEAARRVLVRNGWKIDTETNANIYERNPEAEASGKDVLFFTNVKQHSMLVYSSYTHLNVFLHPTAEGAEVEVRYIKVTPVIKRFVSYHNDKLANRLLDQIEHEVSNAQ